jgi:hypothetical protein
MLRATPENPIVSLRLCAACKMTSFPGKGIVKSRPVAYCTNTKIQGKELKVKVLGETMLHARCRKSALTGSAGAEDCSAESESLGQLATKLR